VTDLQPEISLEFSRIGLPENLKLNLIASDNQEEAEWEIIRNQGRKLTLRPKHALNNYRSYQVIIHKETKDYVGNTLDTARESVFLPIKR
jgi:hypothetical protein